MGQHKAPKEYEMEALEDVDVDNDELAQYFLEWADKYKPTQGAFNELVGKFKELSVAQEEEDTINIEQETQSLDTNEDKMIKGIKTWGQGWVAKGVWSEEDFNELKVFDDKANVINALKKDRKYYGEKQIPT